jgi:hypothetical protein
MSPEKRREWSLEKDNDPEARILARERRARGDKERTHTAVRVGGRAKFQAKREVVGEFASRVELLNFASFWRRRDD